jgi:hypothetical protein
MRSLPRQTRPAQHLIVDDDNQHGNIKQLWVME